MSILFVKKISRNIGIMGRVKYYLSSKALLLLYNALVLPHLNYCAVIWGSAYQSRMKKRAIRIIDHKPFCFPSSGLFVKYNFLKITDLVVEQNIVILLAFLNGNLPIPISVLFNFNRPLGTRAPEHFITPFSRCNFRISSLSFTAPKAWNSIICNMYPQLSDVPINKTTLKRQVRTKLINTYL